MTYIRVQRGDIKTLVGFPSSCKKAFQHAFQMYAQMLNELATNVLIQGSQTQIDMKATFWKERAFTDLDTPKAMQMIKLFEQLFASVSDELAGRVIETPDLRKHHLGRMKNVL